MKALIKFFDSIKNWIFGIFEDSNKLPSSKRIVGVACGASLCVCLFLEKAPDEHIIDAVALLAFGCLGLSSIDRFSDMKKGIKEALSSPKNEEPVVETPQVPSEEVAISEECGCTEGCQCKNKDPQ
jgi:hypothetical protein